MTNGDDPHTDRPRKGRPGPDETVQRRRRNLAIAGGLAAFIVLIYLVTLARIGGAS